MKLLLIAYVASAAASEQCQEQTTGSSPHLHKRDWHDGGHHRHHRDDEQDERDWCDVRYHRHRDHCDTSESGCT